MPDTTREAPGKPVTIDSGEELAICLIRGEGDERLLHREGLTVSDLVWPRGETWLCGMRAGTLGTDLHALAMRVLPGENKGADRLQGYAVELTDQSRSFRKHFSIHSLTPVARRAAQQVLKEGAIAENDKYSFYLTAVPGDRERNGENGQTRSAKEFRVKRRSEPLVFEPRSLAECLKNSEPLVGPSTPLDEEAGSDLMHVFWNPEAWEEGHQLARRGGDNESAAVCIGGVFRDLDSSELFVVVEACFEAEHAAEEKLAVTFTGETWAHVRKLLDVRKQRLGRAYERILGSIHGHPFMPEADDKGRRMCDNCALAKVCSRTTAVASLADIDWHRAVFGGSAPWAVLALWGYNAREQEDWRLYGLADGTLTPRTIRVLQS